MQRKFRHLRTAVLSLVALTVGIYLIVGGLFYALQDRMIFYPSVYPPGILEEKAAKAGFAPWFNDLGARIGWQSLKGVTDDVLLIFHGQGGNALNTAGYRGYTAARGGNCQTFLLEYPGNGNRSGPPSEEALCAAGVEAIDLLGKKPGRRIWILGASLGSGVACAAIRDRGSQIAGLILLTPFSSLTDVAGSNYPFFPVDQFLRTRLDSERNLANYGGPVAFFVCQKDTTIPIRFARKLYDGFPGIKKLWIEPQTDHDASALLYEQWPTLWQWLLTNTPIP